MRRRARATSLSAAEESAVEKLNTISGDIGCTKGFCHDCESFVDETAGKLHRQTCQSVEPSRRRVA